MPSSTPSSRARFTRYNLILKLAIALGVGVLGGFGFFAFLWRTQCQTLLQQKGAIEHSKLQVQDQQIKEKHHTELSALQSDLQKAQDQNVRQREEYGRQTEMYQNQLETLQKALERQVAANEKSSSTPEHEMELRKLQEQIVQRSEALLRREFGVENEDFSVDLLLGTSADAQDSHRVRLTFPRRRGEMTHTIFTFLTLTSLGLYDGTVLRLKDEQWTGGTPRDAMNVRLESTLTRQYHEMGLVQPLWIREVSPVNPCREWTVGMLNHGPEFTILREPAFQDGSLSCPGLVSQGQEFLRTFHGESLYIYRASVVRSEEEEYVEEEGAHDSYESVHDEM